MYKPYIFLAFLRFYNINISYPPCILAFYIDWLTSNSNPKPSFFPDKVPSIYYMTAQITHNKSLWIMLFSWYASFVWYFLHTVLYSIFPVFTYSPNRLINITRIYVAATTYHAQTLYSIGLIVKHRHSTWPNYTYFTMLLLYITFYFCSLITFSECKSALWDNGT